MGLPEKIHLEIVTPDKAVYSGDVDSLVVPARTGYIGILPGHAPLLAELGIGEIEFTADGKTEYVACSWGFVEVLPDRVVLLAQAAELSSDIDLKRAEEAVARAEKLLSSKDPDVDYAATELAMLRALSRINAAKSATTRQSVRKS
ncbi:MAG: F0F1 ATP synthase subunit epsilon [Acidobacteriota bacterium]|jgi:F-type H+-transporting ATPase subunit epsilon|nr:F0F1 ATP synthase subunit epsilon [Acidobacteriota bacterium]